MITGYNRPQTLEEAVALLAQPDTRPLGGGIWLNQPHEENFSVVDLQALGLTKIHKNGNNLDIDACVTLQQLLESTHCPVALNQAIRQESSLNIRNAATVAGSLISCDGRSPFATAILALDAKLNIVGGPSTEAGSQPTSFSVGDIFALRNEALIHKLIIKITIPLNIKMAFENVARSPMDRPIVCVALTQWTSGRTRLALGGYGKTPLLAMDGTEADGLESAARIAYGEAADEWASAEYRADVAATLAKRCLGHVEMNK